MTWTFLDAIFNSIRFICEITNICTASRMRDRRGKVGTGKSHYCRHLQCRLCEDLRLSWLSSNTMLGINGKDLCQKPYRAIHTSILLWAKYWVSWMECGFQLRGFGQNNALPFATKIHTLVSRTGYLILYQRRINIAHQVVILQRKLNWMILTDPL